MERNLIFILILRCGCERNFTCHFQFDIFFLSYSETNSLCSWVILSQKKSVHNYDEFITEEIHPYPTQPPPPTPPMHGKLDIYHDPEVFAELDQIAINVRFCFFSSNYCWCDWGDYSISFSFAFYSRTRPIFHVVWECYVVWNSKNYWFQNLFICCCISN